MTLRVHGEAELVMLQVPLHVRDQIKTFHLLGYRGESGNANGYLNGTSNGSSKAQQLLGAPAGAA